MLDEAVDGVMKILSALSNFIGRQEKVEKDDDHPNQWRERG